MKRLLTLIPVLAFCLLCTPAVLADTVSTPYLDQDGVTQNCENATTVTESDAAWSDAWYLVQNSMTINSDVAVNGNVGLILADGATLTVNGSLVVSDGSSLNLYAQSPDQTGTLTVTSTGNHAAIGNGFDNAGDGGTVNIYSGNVNATSKGAGAAIGGSWHGKGGAVHIYGGTVTAITESGGAAIGSGSDTLGAGVTVTISGGTVNATSTGSGAAIGMGTPGALSDVCDVTISGGMVTATTQEGSSVAIGGSNNQGSGSAVTLSGGTVNATHKGVGPAIEGNEIRIANSSVTASSADGSAFQGNVTVDPAGQPLMVLAGESEDTAVQVEGSPFTAQATITDLVNGKNWVWAGAAQTVSAEYLDLDGSMKNCPAALAVTEKDRTWTSGWYLVNTAVTIPDNVTVNGDVKLILADGAQLTVQGSILVQGGKTFTVYGQSTGSEMGRLEATAKAVDYASIGGTGSYTENNTCSTGTVNIVGGNIIAISKEQGAAIGSGHYSSGGIVNLYGGIVTATSDRGGAAIGSGSNGKGIAVNLYGGTVNATANSDGMAIGGGNYASDVAVTISGGTVNAISNGLGAAIGKNDSVFGTVTVTISGGTVTACNTRSSAINAVDGTVVISPAGQALQVLAGSSESDGQPLEGSPFTEQKEISELLEKQSWFHSEVTSIYPVTGILLDPAELTLKPDETATLTATVTPDNATNPALRWTSSDTDVVTVDASATRTTGTVTITAKAAGTATITVEATDGSGVQARCTVTVEAIPASTPSENEDPVETPSPTAAPEPTAAPAPTKAPEPAQTAAPTESAGGVAPTATPKPATGKQIVYYTCPACGTHDWTATEEGYRCDKCGYLESLRQLSGYGNVKGVYDPNKKDAAVVTIPQTRDESNPALWLVLMTVSAVALGGLLFRKYSNKS